MATLQSAEFLAHCDILNSKLSPVDTYQHGSRIGGQDLDI